MKLMSRKIRLFSISNIAVSFMLTSFMGINYSNIYETESLANPDTVVAEADAEPVSQNGDEGNTKEVVVEQKVKPTKINNVVTKKRVANNVTYAPAKYSEVTGNAVVEYAKRYLGLRYVSGGYSLTYGTDCSGFTKLIYQEFGVTLSRSVVAQSGSGTYIRKADLQKGDLVFYGKGNGSVSHVGIYIGNGQVIHESNHRDGVKISSVNMMQYITARRVINSTSIKIVEQKLEEQNKKEEENLADTTSTTNNDSNSEVNNEVNNSEVNNNDVVTSEGTTNDNSTNTNPTTTNETPNNSVETIVVEESTPEEGSN